MDFAKKALKIRFSEDEMKVIYHFCDFGNRRTSYRKFIKDICNNKFKTLDDIIKVANYMNKIVVKNDINRWYA